MLYPPHRWHWAGAQCWAPMLAGGIAGVPSRPATNKPIWEGGMGVGWNWAEGRDRPEHEGLGPDSGFHCQSSPEDPPAAAWLPRDTVVVTLVPLHLREPGSSGLGYESPNLSNFPSAEAVLRVKVRGEKKGKGNSSVGLLQLFCWYMSEENTGKGRGEGMGIGFLHLSQPPGSSPPCSASHCSPPN